MAAGGKPASLLEELAAPDEFPQDGIRRNELSLLRGGHPELPKQAQYPAEARMAVEEVGIPLELGQYGQELVAQLRFQDGQLVWKARVDHHVRAVHIREDEPLALAHQMPVPEGVRYRIAPRPHIAY